MKKSGWINESQRGIKVIWRGQRVGERDKLYKGAKKHASQGGIFMRKG